MIRDWVTRDGRRLKISEMDTEHIRNAVAMLRRNGRCSLSDLASAFHSLSMCSGDMATYYAEQACAGLHPSASLEVLEEELERREHQQPKGNRNARNVKA